MSAVDSRNVVHIRESGNGPYGQVVTVGHHVFGADEPGGQGGHDTGPDPFELLMAGLGACTVMTVRMYAARKNMPLTDVSCTVRHLRQGPPTPDGKPGNAFERRLVLDGPLSDEQRASLLLIAERCPVGRAIEAGVEVVTVG
ncbi:OsmC family protein [Segnochrobactraceae bacterium EtOH-i3]